MAVETLLRFIDGVRVVDALQEQRSAHNPFLPIDAVKAVFRHRLPGVAVSGTRVIEKGGDRQMAARQRNAVPPLLKKCA
jgi:hypothetical protein